MAALRYFFSILMIPFSFLVAGMSLTAYMASYISPNASTFVTLAGLGIPIILIINLAFLMYWIVRKKWWVIVPIAAILLNVGYLSSIFQITISTPKIPQQKETIRIASYNVGKFKSWQKYDTQHAIANYLQNDKINIVCFQEYMDKKDITADTLNKLFHVSYHSVYYLPGSESRGIALFSKFPILRSGNIPFESTSNSAMWADLQIGEKTVRVINCHMQTTNFSRKQKELNKQTPSDANIEQIKTVYQGVIKELTENFKIRATQADRIRQVIDTTTSPVIICGDFNDTPSSYTYHRIKSELKDSFRSRGNGYAYTFRNLHKLLRIDFIFYSPQLECFDYDSPTQDWSDHNPVVSEFYLQ